MKITENEVEVAKRQTVIAAIVVVVVVVAVILLPSSFSLCALLFSHQRSQSCLAREDMVLKLTGCCFRLQNALPLRTKGEGGRTIAQRLTSNHESGKQQAGDGKRKLQRQDGNQLLLLCPLSLLLMLRTVWEEWQVDMAPRCSYAAMALL